MFFRKEKKNDSKLLSVQRTIWYSKSFLTCFLIAGWVLVLSSQSIDTEFGKNRIQYHDDFNKWWMYETENFITYWYGKGRNIGQAAVQIAEFYHDGIQSLAEHTINDKIEIIVYTDLDDLRQSNIGTEEIFETNADETKVMGSKMFVYFNGNHQHLKSQIREGIAQVFINSMFSRSSLQEIITSSADLIIPEWFGKGFTNYANTGWDNQIDDELRELWQRKKIQVSYFQKTTCGSSSGCRTFILAFPL